MSAKLPPLRRPLRAPRARSARAALCALLSATTLLAVSDALAAGRVDLHFVEPALYTDAGSDTSERARTQRVLGEHLRRLGNRLPDGQRLELDVLDVDLAGRLEPFRAGEVRVLRGDADLARVTIRYTLRVDGQVLKSGEDRLSEFDAPRRTGHLAPKGDLAHDRLLLERWFNERFVPGH